MEPLFRNLRERLLRAGVAPHHVRRYLAELEDHLSDLLAEEEQSGRSSADASTAALARLGSIDDLASAMTARREFLSWSARAPWLVFCCAPVCALAAAYLVACVYLWCGWHLFLPQADTPFGARVHASMFSVENLYFQAGRFYYFFAPVLIGWGVAVVALRQRVKAAWPLVAWLLIAWMGTTARIEASRSTVPHGFGHIRMGFFFGPTHGFILSQLLDALAVLSIVSAPYLLSRWRLSLARS
jgi:hypothetical protein